MNHRPIVLLCCSAVCILLSAGAGQTTFAQTPAAKLPPLKPQPSAQAVVNEHLDALNRCDWTRLMAQYPPDVQFFLPGGQTIQGREEVGKVFANLVRPFKDGGLCGVTFEALHVFQVENTISAQWRATSQFLAEPYLGADAYVTRNGLLQAIVTTFQPEQMKKK